MKYIYVLLIFFPAFFVVTNCTEAQEPEQISFEQGNQFSVSSTISLNSLVSLEGDWIHLKEVLGEPVEENCQEYNSLLGFEPACSFAYDGLEINYANVGNGIELASVKLTNDTPFLEYEDTAIRVGDPISSLEPLFPEAYANRGPIHNSSGESLYWIHLNIGGSVAYISFRYDPNSVIIEEISFTQVLT